MPDFDVIATAIAARFAPGAMTAPTGYDPITVSTVNPPEGMLPVPCVITFLDGGDFTSFPGKRDSHHNFAVRFYFNQAGDMERDQTALRKWLTVLVDQLKASSQLAGTVTSARVMTWTVGLLPYMGQQYTGIELGVRVIVNEGWAAVA